MHTHPLWFRELQLVHKKAGFDCVFGAIKVDGLAKSQKSLLFRATARNLSS
jgi:hypothetical protein